LHFSKKDITPGTCAIMENRLAIEGLK